MKRFTTKFLEKVPTLLPIFVIILLILSLIVVGFGNHALYTNTKVFESVSDNYIVPQHYSLSDMKVLHDSTYYTIKDVIYVFRSVGTHFDTTNGILTQGYYVGIYGNVLLAWAVSLLYFIIEFIKEVRLVGFKKLTLKRTTRLGYAKLVAFGLFLFLTVQLLFPLM
jgi:hypothetical protein